MNSWYSNGKLMLTGEYAVLRGAASLAIPVKYGQSLIVNQYPGDSFLNFETEVQGNKWFKAVFDPLTLELQHSTDEFKAKYIQSIVLAARQLNPLFLSNARIINAKAQINFNVEWGLGSSSTLISNIAWWANVNPFELNKLVSNGSGYDIACARSEKPIIYSIIKNNATFEQVEYQPTFANQLFFVYLGQKQATEQSIKRFNEETVVSKSDIYEISDLTYAFASCQNVNELIHVINIHENIIGKILGIEPIKSSMFSDFKGTVKSLGAWGGDFCLAATTENDIYVNNYFENKGLTTIFKFNDMLLKP
jgi:mevalonate kinase